LKKSHEARYGVEIRLKILIYDERTAPFRLIPPYGLGRLENELTKAEAEREQLQDANKTLTVQYQQQSKEILQVQQRVTDTGGRYEIAQQANEKAGLKIKIMEEQVMQLEKQTAVAQDKILILTASNDRAEGRIEVLRDENSTLKQEKAIIEGQFKQLQCSL